MTRVVVPYSALRLIVALAATLLFSATIGVLPGAGDSRRGAAEVELAPLEPPKSFLPIEANRRSRDRSVAPAQGAKPASGASRAERAHQRAQDAERRRADRGPLHDRELVFVRAALLVLGVFAFAAGRRLETRPMQKRVRDVLLIALTFASVATYYHLFLGNYKSDFGSTDVFHYYVGSKYADELGYFGLYECSLVAIEERGVAPAGQKFGARDLRTMKVVGVKRVLAEGADCPDRFSAQRWTEFGDDVVSFIPHWGPSIPRDVWKDFGYNASPVWNAVGGAVANALPIDHPAARFVLQNLDRVLIGAGFACVAWAFGWEVACLVIIAWGTGYLWRYGFSGDGYLRHLWWSALFAGVCLLRLGRPAASGAMLAFSTTLRVFPAVPAGAVVLHGLVESFRQRRIDASSLRFVVIAGLTTILLGGIAIVDAGGLGGLAGFAEKIGTFSQLDVTNRVGLGTVVAWTFGDSTLSTIARGVTALAGLALFGWALPRIEVWEAPLAGLALIPFLTDPTNYYYEFVPLGFVWAARRPAVVGVLVLACLAWNANGWLFYRTYEEYFGASVITVIASLCVLALLAFGAPRADEAALEAPSG